MDTVARSVKRLKKLQSQSTAALDVVTTTISLLKQTNDKIAEERDNLAEAICQLNSQRMGLGVLFDKNTNIINNFTRLIEGDTEN